MPKRKVAEGVRTAKRIKVDVNGAMVSWLINVPQDDIIRNPPRAFNRAAEVGCLTSCKWIAHVFCLTRQHVKTDGNYAFRYAARNGHIEVLKWIASEFKFTVEDVCNWNHEAFRSAACKGHLDILQWMHEKFGITPKDTRPHEIDLVTGPAYNGYLSVLQWIHGTFKVTHDAIRREDNAMLRNALSQGNYAILEWRVSTFGITEQDADDIRNRFRWIASGSRTIRWLICMGFVPTDQMEGGKLVDQDDFKDCMPFAPGMEKYIVAEICQYAFGDHKL